MGPQRTLTFLSPSEYEEGSEVSLAPFPKVKDALHQIEWDDEDWYESYEVEDADKWALDMEEPQLNTARETLQKKWPSTTKSTR